MITDKRLHFLIITTATSMWISRARKASVFTLISLLTQPWISACSDNIWRKAKCLQVQNWLIRSLDSLQTRSFNYSKLKTSLKKGSSLVRSSSSSLFTLTSTKVEMLKSIRISPSLIPSTTTSKWMEISLNLYPGTYAECSTMREALSWIRKTRSLLNKVMT